MTEIERMKNELKKSSKKPRPLPKSDLLSTGSTLLNLACTGRHEGGFAKGHYILLVGDTDSGKTWLTLTCLAEATLNKNFDDYRLIFDNAENGAMMDLAHYFGSKLVDRIEPPAVDEDGPLYSRTIEEFYYNVDDAIKQGTPFIYILDSIDVLSSDPEEKKFGENKTAFRKGKERAGSYGDGKAKINSSNLRKVVGDLGKNGSILIIINQTRDNFNPAPFTPAKTRSGGWALEFYSHLVLWSSLAGQIKKQVKGKARQVGITSKVKVKRSRITGKKRTVEVPIYHSFGIDDIGSCVRYLLDEGRWKNKGGYVEVVGMGPTWKGKVEEIIKRIESEGLESELQALVGETWAEIEELSKVSRKNRYSSE